MIARYAGACLGLLAFAVSVLAGLSAGNPMTSILSRAISALIVCCIVGAVIGAVAQAVVNEHISRSEARMLEARQSNVAGKPSAEASALELEESTGQTGQPGPSAA